MRRTTQNRIVVTLALVTVTVAALLLVEAARISTTISHTQRLGAYAAILLAWTFVVSMMFYRDR